jgi:hypothetical protein
LKKNNKLNIPEEYDVNKTLENNSFESINENYDILLYFSENETDFFKGYLFIDKNTINNVNENSNQNFDDGNKFKDNIPIVKFQLMKNGTISEELYNEKIDKNYATILKSFLEQLSTFYKEYLSSKKTNYDNYTNYTILNNATTIYSNLKSRLDEEGFILNFSKNEFYDLSYDNLFEKIINNSETNQNIRKGILMYMIVEEINI